MMDPMTGSAAVKFVYSLGIVVILSAVRYFLVHQIRRRSEFLSKNQRLWMSRAKNGSVLLIVVGLVSIWWPELREFALSIAAAAVALVIATKELILCFSGSVLKAGSGAFGIGDWIEVGDLRGEVIEQNMLSTTIQELDTENNSYEYTGKTVTIPNSVFLSQSVKNMNFMKRYVFHRFTIVTEPVLDPFEAKRWILNRIDGYSENFMDIARRYNAMIEKRAGIDIPGAEPRVRIRTTDAGKNEFSVIVFCPTAQAVEMEQRVTRDFMRFLYKGGPVVEAAEPEAAVAE